MTGESCFLLLACLLLMRISCACWAESYRVIIARKRLYDSKAGISIYLLFPLGKFCWPLRWPTHSSLLEISSCSTTSWEAPQFQKNYISCFTRAEYEGIREWRDRSWTWWILHIKQKGLRPWCHLDVPFFIKLHPKTLSLFFSWRMSLQPSIVLTDAVVFSVSSVRIGTPPCLGTE